MIIEPVSRNKEQTPKTPEIGRAPSSTPSIQKDVNLSKLFRDSIFQNQSEGIGFRGGPKSKRKGYVLAMWSILSALIDGLVLISLSAAFLLFFGWVVGSSAQSIASLLFTQTQSLQGFMIVFLLVSWVYLNVARLFFGSTIGESTCDLSLGHPVQKGQVEYMWRLFLRTTLIVATGLVFLPVLSLALGRDLAGQWSGLRLMSLK